MRVGITGRCGDQWPRTGTIGTSPHGPWCGPNELRDAVAMLVGPVSTALRAWPGRCGARAGRERAQSADIAQGVYCPRISTRGAWSIQSRPGVGMRPGFGCENMGCGNMPVGARTGPRSRPRPIIILRFLRPAPRIRCCENPAAGTAARRIL